MSSKVETNISQRPAWMGTEKASGPVVEGKPAPKTLGDVLPVKERLESHPHLLGLFAHYGTLQKIRRKLKQFSGRDACIILARNTVGAADPHGNIYLGVEFLEQYGANEPLLAAVLAHEWGHLISQMNKHGNLDHLNWEQIFELRREEEASADTFCGRMLAMMDYSPEPICSFLQEAERGAPTLKYYAAPIRAAIITEAHRLHAERRGLTHKLFPPSIYPNPYRSRTILADE